MTDTLARHGVAYRFNFLAGTPYFDDEGWLAGFYGEEPKWREEDLTSDQEAELQGWIAEHLTARPQDDPMFVRWATLERNGVEHCHRKGKPLMERRPAYGYECLMCRGYVVATDPGDVPFVGGPMDGRWLVVPADRQTWIVPLPKRITAGVLDAGPDFSMPTAEYRRGRDGRFYFSA